MRRLSIIILAMAMVLILGCGVTMAAGLIIDDELYHTDKYSVPQFKIECDTEGKPATLTVWVGSVEVFNDQVQPGTAASPTQVDIQVPPEQWTALGWEEGKYTIKARLEGEGFFNEKNATLYADWNAPVISDPDPAEGAFVSSLTSFSVTITDAGTGVNTVNLTPPAGVTISGPQVNGDRYTWDITAPADNKYTFTVTASDKIADPSHEKSQSFNVTLDSLPPSITNTKVPNDTRDNSPTNTEFIWTVDEINPAQYTILVNDTEVLSLSHKEASDKGMVTAGSEQDSWTVTFNGDTNGDGKQDVFLKNDKYTVILKVKDAAGNEGGSEESTFVFDNTAPEYNAGALPAYVGPNTNFTLAFKDALAGFEGGEQIMIWAYGPDNKLIGNEPISKSGARDEDGLLTLSWADIANLLKDSLKDGDQLTIKVLAHDRLGNPALENAEKEAIATVLNSTWDNTAPKITGLPTNNARYDITKVKLLYKVVDNLSDLDYATVKVGDKVYDTEKNANIIYFVPDGVELNLASLLDKDLTDRDQYTLDLTVYDVAGNSSAAEPVTITVLVMDRYIEYSLQASMDIKVNDEVIAVSRYSRPQIYVDYPTDLMIPSFGFEFSIDGTPITWQNIIVSTITEDGIQKDRITIVPPYDLVDGIHELKVSLRVPDEEFISYDGIFRFGVDTKPPIATQITKDWDGKSPVKVQIDDSLSGVNSVMMGIADKTALLPAVRDPENPNVFSIKFGPTFSDGTYTLIVAYVDNMGNQGQKAFTLTVGAPAAPVEDKVAPTVNGEIKDGALNITATDNIDLDRIVVTVGDEGATYSVSGTSATVAHVLPTKIGLYNIQVVAYDKAGNASTPWTTTYKVRPKYEPGKSSGFGWDMWKY